MKLKDIHNIFSSDGYLFIGFENLNGWFFKDRNIHLDNSRYIEKYGEYEVGWIYLNTYEDKVGLAVVLKGSPLN